jgi:catechol 2,3-dioxygenase-like lactoylglutathione lyase family enzyme
VFLVFDHVIIDVADLEDSRGFYERALAPLGITVVMEFDDRCAFGGQGGRPQFWIAARGTPGARGVHLAFGAENQSAVDAFHRAAVAAGGSDNGPPGLRPRYHASYYGAFVLDRHGNNIEAVHHGSTS